MIKLEIIKYEKLGLDKGIYFIKIQYNYLGLKKIYLLMKNIFKIILNAQKILVYIKSQLFI